MSSKNSKAEEALQTAYERPSQKTVEGFYREFITGTFLVPRRFQEKPVENSSSFPSPFTDLFALTTGDNNYIPVFSSQDELSNWTEESLECHELTGQEICSRAPDDWWISLNPAGDWGKEISPWEVKLLRDGEHTLAELVAEQLSSDDDVVSFQGLSEEQQQKLTPELERVFNSQPTLQAIYGGIHKSENQGERYIFGVIHSQSNSSEKAKEAVEATLARLLIGDFPIDISFGHSLEESPNLALFRFSKPIVTKT